MKRDKIKILWVSPHNLLDTTSGAAITVRQMLIELQSRDDFEIKILSASCFDSEKTIETTSLFKNLKQNNMGQFINVEDYNLKHITLITHSTKRIEMQALEEEKFFSYYCDLLDSFNPSFIFLYNAMVLERHILYEAKYRNIKTAAYIPSISYQGNQWRRNLDLILTDSKATAGIYKDRDDFEVFPVGKFIDMNRYLAKKYERKHILFINPSYAKGVLFVLQLAEYYNEYDSNIIFEIVDSRGDASEFIKEEIKRKSLKNIIITPNTLDMRAVYERARILLVPSFWWESSGRVIVEALINGIPIIGSNYGGIPEMIGEGGILITFPKNLHEEPYNRIPTSEEFLQEIYSVINKLFYDEEFYQLYIQKAYQSYEDNHNINTNTEKLVNLFYENIDTESSLFQGNKGIIN